MAIEELVQLVRCADARVRLDVDAEFDDRFDLTRDQRAREPILGNPEHHHAAEMLVGFVHDDRMTGEPELARGGQPGRTAADHPNARQGRGRDVAVGGVPNRVRGEALDTETLGHESLQRSNGHWRIDRTAPARALTRRRADASTHRRERIRRARDEIRPLEVTFRDRGYIGTGVGVHGTRRPARLVRPEPVGVRNSRCRHQIIFRRCKKRSVHAIANNRTKNVVVATATRLPRVLP